MVSKLPIEEEYDLIFNDILDRFSKELNLAKNVQEREAVEKEFRNEIKRFLVQKEVAFKRALKKDRNLLFDEGVSPDKEEIRNSVEKYFKVVPLNLDFTYKERFLIFLKKFKFGFKIFMRDFFRRPLFKKIRFFLLKIFHLLKSNFKYLWMFLKKKITLFLKKFSRGLKKFFMRVVYSYKKGLSFFFGKEKKKKKEAEEKTDKNNG